MNRARRVPIDTGGRVGRYLLGRRLGSGGMGAVYEAVEEPGGTTVAVKLPYSELLENDYTSRRFRDEGIAGSIVAHPHLGHIVDRGETEAGIPYLVMERVLGERLDPNAVLSLRECALIVQQLLEAIAALHAAGIVHGDIKTDNVLVERGADGHGFAKLIDFGLAHPDLDGTAPLKSKLVSGTPDYMAPEVIRGDGTTIASDIYAAGVILYELITGVTPFGGGSSAEIARRHLREELIPPSLRCSDDVPPILDRIVMRALDKDPHRRYASAGAFAAALGIAMPCLEERLSRPTRHAAEAPTLDWAPAPS